MNTTTYLHVSGVLGDNGVYRARPGHESPSRGRSLEGNPMYRLVLLGPEGKVLLSVAPRVAPRGCGHAHGPRRQGVRGVLPLHPDASAYELRVGEVCLYRASIGSPPPPITPHECHEKAGKLTLMWRPGEPAPTPCAVTYAVVVAMASGRRITVARGLTDLKHTVDLSTFPFPGKGIVQVVASDGVRSSQAQVGTIDVVARPPTVYIVAPGSSSVCIPFGQALSLIGCCLDMSGQPCPPEPTAWYLDGERIASGTLLAACTGLPSGPHRITFAYQPEATRAVETTLTVQVDEPDVHHEQWQALMDA
jgi:hypothetical protein